MNKMFIIVLLVIMASTQTTVTPKTQACACSNLLSQPDCIAKSGCAWTFATSTNSTTNITITSTTQGTCANSTTPTVALAPPTYCLNVTNVTLCAQTIGCAFVNNTCTIFTGCSAYVQTTNAACQAISTRCTTDGTRCVAPTACSTYTTQALCTGNIATSGAKSCTWTNSGASGTCADKVCSDAPTTYSTQSQCNRWIAGCLTTGKGCTTTLGACSSYTIANGCSGMIGSDGPCTTNTAAGSTLCRPLVCTDAATTITTNLACSTFLSGCVTNGKGCVSSLSACSTYTQTQGCTGLIGSDGPCTANTISGSTACRALACTDAPASTSTNAGCVSFLAGCVTTGSGCTSSLGPCSSYTGTTTTCSSFLGTDGNCKGTSATAGSCSARTCADAPTTTNTNAACAAFQTGCITTGAGCTATLGSCSSYTGTNTTCTQYIGSDGNCTAPSSQTSPANCVAKACSDAPNTTTTNAACQAFSYQCVTNGAGCVVPTTCEATGLAITCQGSQSCSSSQICLNRSACTNYQNQSQCLLNQQQYTAGGTVYLRACTWSSGACSNQVCTALATSLTTDTACSAALAGCLTNGGGCIDISAPCTDYKGTQTQCNAFKGLNGTQTCGNATGATSTTNCIIKTCANANTGGAITSQANCASWLTGCYFDGKDNCTNSSCDKYYGVLTTCTAITTAVDGSNKPQICYQPTAAATPTTACAVKACSQAPNTITTNADCNNFLAGCITNGAGCVDTTSACTVYTGTLATCSTFNSNRQACSKSFAFCRGLSCTSKTPPAGTANNKLWCQQFIDQQGYNCQYDTGPSCISAAAGSCNKFVPTTGTTDSEKAQSCYSLKLNGTVKCGFATGGSTCIASACSQFAIPASATTILQKALFCRALTTDSVNIVNSCGLASATSTVCSARQCTDLEIFATFLLVCSDYKFGCGRANDQNCYQPGTDCTAYVIPVAFTTDLQKTLFCAATIKTEPSASYCSYRASISITNCSASVSACTDITLSAQNVLASDNDKLAFCRASRTGDNEQCAYTSTTSGSCAVLAACTTYTTVGATDDAKQIYCSKLIDDSGKACVFTSGNTCAVLTATKCSDLTTVGSTALLKFTVCSAYIFNNKSCGYAPSSTASVCSDAQCTDVDSSLASFTFCKNYLFTCVYDGLNCITIGSFCTNYNVQTAGSGALVNCQNLTNEAGDKCTYNGGATCVARTCADTITNPNAANCAAYLNTCVFNGLNCVDKAANCNLYQPQGANDAFKVAICNSLSNTSSAKCTYFSGSNTCINTVASCNYDLPATSQNDLIGKPACAQAQDPNGLLCAWDPATPAKCTARICALAITANSDSECNTWQQGCDQNPASPCSLQICSNAPVTATTNAACATFRKGCLTNGAGCVETTVACSGYKGNQTTCNAFVGNSIPCTNTSTAAATDACQDRTCAANTTAKSDSECKTWLSTCVWKGSSGCSDPQPCASFTGTADSCPTFTANDGPCYGTGTAASPALCAANVCTSAPSTYNTDAQCKSWRSTCMTNGFGCITSSSATCSSILSPLVCPLYKSTAGLFCDLANQCKTKPSTCGGFTTASECNNTPLVGQTSPTCAWSAATTTCIPLTCSLLPVTLTTDGACSAVISTCTTNGAGCVTKGACSTYNKQACGPATTTDTQKVCIWSNSVCRPIQCTDNTTASSDAACNTYLAGCRTTGLGCAATLTCSVFTSAALCLFDSTNSPCLWYKSSATAAGTCINYTQCSDVIQSTHAACQAASPLCTTNGTTCIAITGCSKTVLQASCILGTDGNCGWLPAAGTTAAACALYTNCSAATGTTTSQCQAWGPTCISNGTTCLSKSTCSSYSTQIACGNAGTDGTCFWVAPTGTATTGTCRLQLCSDATTNMTTHTGCVSFSASTACTTSGTVCIPQATCSAYTAQAGCVQGTDGVCFWATTSTSATNTTAPVATSVCRLKQCTDSLLTSSAACSTAISGVKCVSNGINCIPQSTCSSYTAREACLGGGSDGACAFTPGTNATTPNVGTCAQFTQCSNANSDQTACNTRLDACYFNSTTTNGTTTSSCQPHTCLTKALGSSCQPVPSWDLSTYQICVLTGTTCAAGNPASFTATTCYSNSVGTYSWSVNTSSCTVCISSTPNTTNNTANNTNTHGILFSLVLAIVLLF